MGGIVRQIQAIALSLGPPGLFLVAFLDSSFLSLPEIADLLVVFMVTQRKPLMPIYVIGATLGSIAGCLVLYYIGRKGGDALVRKRFSSTMVDRTLASFRRHGIMAVLIPSLLPPPAPFKIFVLLAGVAGISARRFTLAVAMGRGARYLIEGLLAVRYGERALAFMHENGTAVSLGFVGALAAGFIVYLLWRRVQASRA